MEKGHISTKAIVTLALIVAAVVVYLSFLYSHSMVAPQQNGSLASNYTYIPANSTVAVDLQEELNDSAHYGFDVGQSMFYSTSAEQCSRQLITFCDNNVPSQFVCVNQEYASDVASQHSQIYMDKAQPCPLFILDGVVGCGVVNSYCVVTESTTLNGSP